MPTRDMSETNTLVYAVAMEAARRLGLSRSDGKESKQEVTIPS